MKLTAAIRVADSPRRRHPQPHSAAGLDFPQVAASENSTQHEEFAHQQRVRVKITEQYAYQRIERHPLEVLSAQSGKRNCSK